MPWPSTEKTEYNQYEDKMKTSFDTSVIIAVLVESHPMHAKAFPCLKQAKSGKFELIVASHTLAELNAVLSTLPIKPRISPAMAWRLIHKISKRSVRSFR